MSPFNNCCATNVVATGRCYTQMTDNGTKLNYVTSRNKLHEPNWLEASKVACGRIDCHITMCSFDGYPSSCTVINPYPGLVV